MSSPPLQMDNGQKTIIPPDPREHRRQRKIALQQHIKQMLQRLRDSDDLFLNNSITLAEYERTQRMNGPAWPKLTTATGNVWQSTMPTTNAAQQALVLPNVDVMLPTVWALHSTGRLKRSTRTSMSASPDTTEYINTAATSNPS